MSRQSYTVISETVAVGNIPNEARHHGKSCKCGLTTIPEYSSFRDVLAFSSGQAEHSFPATQSAIAVVITVGTRAPYMRRGRLHTTRR
jgi:hypothetical protein